MYKIFFQGICLYSNFKKLNNLKKIFVFHGLGSDPEDLLPLFNNLFLNIQILIPLIPGHSNSFLNYSPDPIMTFSRKISNFIRFKKVKNFSFFSHSMGGIIPILIVGKILKKKNNILINNEGNLVSSDAGIVSRKTISYRFDDFVNFGFKKLIKKCSNSDKASIRLWSNSLKKMNAKIFFYYCLSIVKWSDSNKLLPILNFYFKKKIYIYGDYSKNLNLIKKLFSHKKICISNTGHFAYLEKREKLRNLIYKELIVESI